MNLTRSNQRGIALVITLIMLAIVTVMAIIFLGVTRRERAAVKVTEDMASARAAADIALEMAKAQAMAQMAAYNDRLKYDLNVSTNYVSPNGFDPAITGFNPYNVGYTDRSGNLLTGNNFLRNVANLQHMARVPVFVRTNDTTGGNDFRYFLDFDRNRVFGTNGLGPVVLPTGEFLSTNGLPTRNANEAALTQKVGDPEWFGTLQHPDQPHSESNRFVFRSAFIALPAGKTLDLNYAHNQVNPAVNDAVTGGNTPNNGFLRNQGVGSWEMNLAAFFRELNTNNYAWHQNSYFYNPPTDGATPGNNVARGESFNDARALLGYRYLNNRITQPPASAFVRPNDEFERDNIDNYGDGPLVFFKPIDEWANRPFVPGGQAPRDNVNRPFPGAPSTNAFYDVQELFTLGTYSAELSGFTNRLMQASAANRVSSYDKYTFYRLLAQLGVDSAPAVKGKVHLNYRNIPGSISTNLEPWTNALEFFKLSADAMLRRSIVTNTYPTNMAGVVSIYTNYTIGDTVVRPDISVTNIQIWTRPNVRTPFNTSNEYSAPIHRILQVAANIYDGITNRTGGFGERWRRYPHYPAVFRPIFTKTATNILVTDFVEVGNARALVDGSTPFYTIEEYWADASTMGTRTNTFLYGQPMVIGAKKGHPNFNEFSVETVVQVSRKMELVKGVAGGPVVQTNQMLVVNLDNLWGIEGWNSYVTNFNRDVRIYADVASSITLSNFSNPLNLFGTGVRYGTNYASTNLLVRQWPGTGANNLTQISNNFIIPIESTAPLLRDAVWTAPPNYFITNGANNVALFQPLGEQPNLKLYTTNRIRYWVLDETTGRLIDFVNLDKLSTFMDVSAAMLGQSRAQANPGGAVATDTNIFEGEFWLTNRLGAGFFTRGMSNQWSVSAGEIQVSDTFWRNYNYQSGDKKRSIDVFRAFIGLPPLYRESITPSTDLRHQMPFTPTRKVYQRNSWQANDPLVHYMASDLRNPLGPTTMIVRPPNLPVTQESGLGKVNELYRPWGSGPNDPANSPYAFNMMVKDPAITRSDDWNFPITLSTNNFFRFANIGWLGRIHRGTPWQTIYLKSGNPTNWFNWAGSHGTHPVYDWKLLDVFTAAPSEEATRGLLSVNQTHSAAWSAVLSGVPVISNTIPNAEINATLNVRTHSKPFDPYFIQPGTAQISNIVQSLNRVRASILTTNWYFVTNGAAAKILTNRIVAKNVFQHIGGVLAAPALTMQSPFLNLTGTQPLYAFTDEVVERIPQQIMSLLQLDEPRFVVYSFGQSLRPAPRSLVTSANFYGLCTNYQVTGEVITKTTFRVEGDVNSPSDPLRAVVENYKILPPPE